MIVQLEGAERLAHIFDYEFEVGGHHMGVCNLKDVHRVAQRHVLLQQVDFSFGSAYLKQLWFFQPLRVVSEIFGYEHKHFGN